MLSSNGVEMHGERHGIAEADGSWLLNRVQKQLQSSRCRICGGQMALQHIFIQVFWFYLSVIIPSILHTHMNSCTYKISTREHICVCARVNAHIHMQHTHLWCGIPGVLPEHIIYNLSMYNFTVPSINCNCRFQLHKVAIIRVSTSEVQKENYMSVFYI